MTAHFVLSRQSWLPQLAGGLAIVMILSLLLHGFVPEIPGSGWVAAAAAMTLAFVRLGAVGRIPRIFVLLALIAAGMVFLITPEHGPAMQRALLQGTAFSAFLTTLGLLRGPVRSSTVIRRAAGRLLGSPTQRMRAVITYGAQFLAVLFNLGVIGMIADIAKDHAQRGLAAGRTTADPRGVTLAALRGAIMMTVWNPIGVGFAIVTAAIPALDPVQFLLLSFVVAMALSAGGLRSGGLKQDNTETAPAEPMSPGQRQAGNIALVLILLGIAAMTAATVTIHLAAGVSFLVAACLVLPAMAFLWPLLEKDNRSGEGPGAFASLSAATASTAPEATIFLAAAVIGAAASILLTGLGLDRMIENGSLPALALILLCLVAVPLAGALMIPHSIVMVLVAQLLGAGPVGNAHPQSLALALCLSWACAISASPISAMSIMTAGQLGISTPRLTFSVNRGFTLYALAAAALVVTLVYLCE